MLKSYKSHQVLYSFAKTSIIFLLITLIIVNAFNAIDLNRANQTYEDSMYINIDNAINAFEDMLYAYKQNCLQFANTGYLLKLANMKTKLYNYSLYDAASNLIRDMRTLKQTHDELTDMILVFNNIDYSINTSGTWQIQNLNDQLRQYNLDIGNIQQDYKVHYDEGGGYLRLIYGIKNCIIIIILDKEKISESLQKYISSQDVFLYVYSTDNNILIACNDQQASLPDGGFKKAPRSGIFTYYYKYNNTSYGMRLKGVTINSLILNIIILSILTAYIFILKKKLYNPLEQILDKLRPGYHYLSGENEYCVLETSVDELNERLSQYQTAFANINTELEQNVINRILTVNDPMSESLQNIYHDLVQTYHICAVSMIIEDDMGDKNSDAIQALLNIITAKYKTSVVFDTNKHTSFFLFFTQTDGSYEDIMAFITGLADDIKKSAFIIAGAGKPYANIEMLKRSYGESLTAMHLIPMDGLETSVSVSLYTDELQTDKPFIISVNDYNKLIHAVTASKKDEAAVMLKNIISNNRHISLSQMRRLLFYIEDTLIMSENRPGANHAGPGSDPSRYVNGIYDARLLFARIAGSLNQYIETQSALDDQISHIVKFIDDHLAEDISLYDLACEMDMSYAYLSQFIKKKMGENFVQYVQNRRIRKSEQLLQETDIEINDITKLAGFNTKNTFYRVFKEKTGVTPGEYRKTARA